MISALLALYAAPMLFALLFVYPRLNEAYRANAWQALSAALGESTSRITLIQSTVQSGARALAGDARLREFGQVGVAARRALLEEHLPAQIDALAQSAGVPIAVELYLDDLPEMPAGAGERPARILPMEQARSEGWFVRYADYPALNAWIRTETEDSFDLSFLCGIWNPAGDRMVGLVRIRLRADEMLSGLEAAFPEGGFVDVMLKNGRTILEIGAQPGDGEAAVLLVGRSAEDAFVVSAHFPEARFYQETRRMTRALARFCAAYTALMLALAIGYSIAMSRRVERIARMVDQFSQGNYGQRILMPERNELSSLVRSLNELMNTVEELLQREYYVKLRQKQTELQMLQAQINPHFLYNILGSIGHLALLGDGKRVNTITRELALFYRMTFSSGSGLISVRQEISQVSKYLDILKIQYQHRLDFVMEVDEHVYPFGTPRFILQPFVENAVNHSWQMSRLTLVIRAELSGKNVQLEVQDDGVGMDAETLHSIFKPSLDRKHYGVTNVDERIKLQFGEGYGVSMTSQPMQGTRVVILIPQTRIESVIPHERAPGA